MVVISWGCHGLLEYRERRDEGVELLGRIVVVVVVVIVIRV